MATAAELAEAIQAGNLAAVSAHLDSSPDLLDAPNDQGLCPVIHALYARQEAIVALLVARGAAIDAPTAAALGRTDRLQELLDQDQRLIESHSPDGWTPLHLAAHFGRREAVELLLSWGASPSALSLNGLRNTPLHAGLAGQAKELAPLLLDSGTDPNATDANGNTLLHLAAFLGDMGTIHLLLDRGAAPSKQNENNITPADLAAGQGHEEVALLLRTRSEA